MEKSKRPDLVLSCVGSHARTKFISLEAIMLWARDGCSGVEWWSGERGTGRCTQCERVQMRESSSNVYWDILYFYIGAFTSYTQIGNKHFLSKTTHVILMMKHWWMELRVLLIDNYEKFDVRLQREQWFPPQTAALANRTSLNRDSLYRLNISGYSRLVGCKSIRLMWGNVYIWYQANYTSHMKPVW